MRLRKQVKELQEKYDMLDWYVWTIANPMKFKYGDTAYQIDTSYDGSKLFISKVKVMDAGVENPPRKMNTYMIDIGGGINKVNQNQILTKEQLLNKLCRYTTIEVEKNITDKDILEAVKDKVK